MIDAQLAAFLEEGLGIHLGTRNERLEPNGARALAVKVDGDGVHFTVFLAKVAADRLISDLKANGFAAVSIGRPIDERACQVKGTVVSIRAAKASERETIVAQFEGFRDQLEAIGIPRGGSDRWATWPAVAIRLKATAVFNQTPHAGTGNQIVSGSQIA
jgi:hypothetical protein